METHKLCPACNGDSKRVKWLGPNYFVVCLICGFTGQTADAESKAWDNWDRYTKRTESYRTDG